MKKMNKEKNRIKETFMSEKNIENKIYINTKEVLTSEEVSIYLGISKNYLYKLTSSRKYHILNHLEKCVILIGKRWKNGYKTIK